MRRTGYTGAFVTDGAAVGLINENLRTHSVLNGNPLEAQPIQGTQAPRLREVCWSGVNVGHRCGNVIWGGEIYVDGHLKSVYLAEGPTIQGDSGGPVWDPVTHKAVGLITGGSREHGGECHLRSDKNIFTPE